MSNKSIRRDPRKSEDDGKVVFVGLSGGVDSSVSSALLKEQGFDVIGVFIKIWHPELSNCDWKAEMRDAMRVCAHLDIKFQKIDLSDEYYKDVIGYLIDEYRIGRTPNPDVMCNKIIKFGHFYDWAMENGADYVATGHYASVKNGELIMGVDRNKDQTYFLWNIKKESLKNTLFPVGEYQKSKVRDLANKFNLPNADKKDSQGLCFIGDVDLKGFLKKNLETKQGDVLDENGEVIGTHDGSEIYTIGERRGFKINNKVDNQTAHYVVSKDLDKNTITVSEDFQKKDIKINILNLSKINLLVDELPNREIEIMVRYNGSLLKAKIEKEKAIFAEPQLLVASGQSVVFYDKNKCLGGGIVDSVE